MADSDMTRARRDGGRSGEEERGRGGTEGGRRRKEEGERKGEKDSDRGACLNLEKVVL